MTSLTAVVDMQSLLKKKIGGVKSGASNTMEKVKEGGIVQVHMYVNPDTPLRTAKDKV